MSDPQNFVRRQRGYPGRDRLDASSMRFRSAVAKLARESEREPKLASEVEPIVSDACAALDALAKRADQTLARSARHQARIRSQLAKTERQLRKAPPASRELIEQEVTYLRALLDDTAEQ